MIHKYQPGDIVGPYTLIESVNGKWKAKCNQCGSVVFVFTSNMTRQKMCKNCRTTLNTKPKTDLTGKRFGRLKAIAYAGNSHWICKCDCGREVSVATCHLNSGHTQSCGCYMIDRINEANFKDISGSRFDKLTVLYRVSDYVTSGGNPLTRYRCRCDCGTELDVLAANLVNGNTKSCGCIGSSYGEYTIRMALNINNIPFRPQYVFDDLRSPDGFVLRFDFGLLNADGSLNCLIEFQGEQHFYNNERAATTNFGQMQRDITDPLKKEYCKTNNIKLYEIRFDDDVVEKIYDVIAKYNASQPRAKQTPV